MTFTKKKSEFSKTECLALAIAQWCNLNPKGHAPVSEFVFFSQVTIETVPLVELNRIPMHLHNLGLITDYSICPIEKGGEYKAIRAKAFFTPTDGKIVGKYKIEFQVVLKSEPYSTEFPEVKVWNVFAFNTHTYHQSNSGSLSSVLDFASFNYHKLFPKQIKSDNKNYSEDLVNYEQKFVAFCNELSQKVFSV